MPGAQHGEDVEDIVDRRVGFVTVPARPAGKAQVLVDGQRAEHALPARHLADAEHGDLVGWRVGDVAAVEHDRAAVRLDDAADRLQQRALARAVRAEQGDDLALLDIDVDPEQHLPAGVPGIDAAHQQQIALALTALVQGLAAGGGGPPDLGDVGVDRRADTAAGSGCR